MYNTIQHTTPQHMMCTAPGGTNVLHTLLTPLREYQQIMDSLNGDDTPVPLPTDSLPTDSALHQRMWATGRGHMECIPRVT